VGKPQKPKTGPLVLILDAESVEKTVLRNIGTPMLE
jgi:hypothetical protein